MGGINTPPIHPPTNRQLASPWSQWDLVPIPIYQSWDPIDHDLTVRQPQQQPHPSATTTPHLMMDCDQETREQGAEPRGVEYGKY